MCSLNRILIREGKKFSVGNNRKSKKKLSIGNMEIFREEKQLYYAQTQTGGDHAKEVSGRQKLI